MIRPTSSKLKLYEEQTSQSKLKLKQTEPNSRSALRRSHDNVKQSPFHQKNASLLFKSMGNKRHGGKQSQEPSIDEINKNYEDFVNYTEANERVTSSYNPKHFNLKTKDISLTKLIDNENEVTFRELTKPTKTEEKKDSKHSVVMMDQILQKSQPNRVKFDIIKRKAL